MKSGAMFWKIALSVVLAVLFGASNVPAQAYSRGPAKVGGGVLRLRQLTGNGPRALVQTPDMFGGASHSRTGPRAWAQLDFQYDTEPEWIDEASFQCYALLHSRTTGEYTLLKGSLAYMDVARGRGHLGVAYVRPSALARFGEVVAVAVEAIVKGETVSVLSEGRLSPGKPMPQEWWKNAKLAPKEGYVLDKSKTPFALGNYDDYEALK